MKMSQLEDRTLSIRQAQEVAGVSRRTIYTWIEKGMLRYKRTVTGHIRIFEASLWMPDAESVRTRAVVDTQN